MEKLDIQGWRKVYKQDHQFAFGNQPNAWLERVTPALDLNCSILDVGCGKGINALYLEECGLSKY